ncbi:hypothetical protein [Granulicella mallensis]|uniref:Uncharacterized protein n=1 Tax=Granulicella mallensis (strain ATCC BAA-1857 / DSM 23137 / MP5ACTX8) TaxID=682795 RepID=G8NZT7_GRAMM|nr:hypothetical protein [Granulicella mallensis]AEU34564.1 hypothetical protein AciX8_0206 [Granulicella mallensis MP5ACTX8]
MNLNLRSWSISFFVPALFGTVLVAGPGTAQGQDRIFSPGAARTETMLLASSDSAKEFFKSVAVSDAVSSSSDDTEDLPDAPSAVALREPVSAPRGQVESTHVASTLTKNIPAGWTAQPLTTRQQVVLGIHNLYSPRGIAGMVFAAGYSQLANGQPNYGSDTDAFKKRLGAVVLRDTTESLFADAILAPMLHEDSRYYVQGPQHNFFYRIAYAASRPLITRTDSGDSTVNGSLLLGYAASSVLTNASYPSINRNFHDTASTYGGSLGGAALGFLLNEFHDEVLQTLHLEKKD